MIRPMKIMDIHEATQVGLALMQKTVYRGLPVSKVSVGTAFRRAVSSAMEQCFVAEHDGRIDGFILMTVMPYWWTCPRSGPRYATDLGFLSRRRGDGKALLEAALEWARKKPRVIEATFQHSSGIHVDTIREVYEAAGLQLLGGCYWIDFREVSSNEQSNQGCQEGGEEGRQGHLQGG